MNIRLTICTLRIIGANTGSMAAVIATAPAGVAIAAAIAAAPAGVAIAAAIAAAPAGAVILCAIGGIKVCTVVTAVTEVTVIFLHLAQ